MTKFNIILVKQKPLDVYVTYRNRLYTDYELDDLKKDIFDILNGNMNVQDIKIFRGNWISAKDLLKTLDKEKPDECKTESEEVQEIV